MPQRIGIHTSPSLREGREERAGRASSTFDHRTLNQRSQFCRCFGALCIVAVLVLSTGLASADERSEEPTQQFAGSAPLKTDSELERRLEKAEQFAGEGRYDLATILWQSVLTESTDTLITRDGRRYTSLAEEVERTIAKLPPDGLRVYRVTADGEAKAILAAGKDDEEAALSAIERKYFLSSLGDDAAFRLGCIALDRYDFVGASRLFFKILHQYPDPSVSRAEVLLRLAVAAARIGDSKSAQEAIEEARQEIDGDSGGDLLAAVEHDIQRADRSTLNSASSSDDWHLGWGNSSRQGRMRRLSSAATEATLTKTWHYRFPLNFSASSSQAMMFPNFTRANASQISTARTDRGLISRWKNYHWKPAGTMLVSEDRLYFKTNEDLTCWDAVALDDDPIWRTAWRNQFQPDRMTQMMLQLSQALGGEAGIRNRPTSQAEVMLFGDRVHQSMSIAHGNVYSIEGIQYPRRAKATTKRSSEPESEWYWGAAPRRSRANWLAAYDARTGKALWHRSPSAEEADDENNLGFMSAPVPFGNLLIVPYTDSGAIWLQALNHRDGSTIWQTYLCDEPVGGCKPWVPIGVSVDGRDAYVVCGAGVVFSIDAVSGEIRFAVRYQRDGEANKILSNFGYGNSQLMDINGWDDDLAIPFGRQLIVMASDHNQLISIDRRTGDLLWTTPRTPLEHPADYCLGVVGSSLFVAGKNCVRRYDLDQDGKLVWELVTGESMGRGMLTDDAIYLPIKDKIARLDQQTGRIVSQVEVHLSAERENPDPVGNLASDGHRIWVVGGNNIFALTNRQQRLAELNRRARQGSAAAFLERMQLRAKENRLDLAVDDLLSAYDLIGRSDGLAKSMKMLLDGLMMIDLPRDQPSRTLDLLAEKCIDAESGSPSKAPTKELAHELKDIIAIAMRALSDGERPGRASAVLSVVPILTNAYQQKLARRALSQTATPDDADLLRRALASRHTSLPVVAAEPLADLVGSDAAEPLKRLLAHRADGVRYAAARGLASLGDKSSLAVLVDLLESDDANMRHQSVYVLKSLTEQAFPFNGYSSAKQRAKDIKAWQDWLKRSANEVTLKLPLPDTEPMLGRTLIASYSSSQVIEIDAEGNEQTRSMQGVWAVHGLPNGHRLVASYGRNSVVQYDENWQIVWQKEQLPGNPFSVRRLQNGNTLVACSNSNDVVEIDPEGEYARRINVPTRPMDARRLANGNTLVAVTGNNRVVEMDERGDIVWEVGGMQGPISVQRLENGNTLVAQMNSGRVVELNRAGEVVWSVDGLSQPYDVQRLPNGNTLIAENNGVLEIDSEGKRSYVKRIQGASGVSRF